MFNHRKGEVQFCHRRIAIGSALGDVLYVQDAENIDDPVDKESVQNVIANMTGRFLLNYKPWHTVKEVEGYPEFVVGTVAAFESENNRSSVLMGYDIMLTAALMAIYLDYCLVNGKMLIRFAADLARYRYPESDDDHQRLAYETILDCRHEEKDDLPDGCRFIIDRYKDVTDCFPLIFNKEVLWYFATWFFRKVFIDELTATTPESRRIFFSALKSGIELWPGKYKKS